jgi:sugar phosphate isomerase/epimerase
MSPKAAKYQCIEEKDSMDLHHPFVFSGIADEAGQDIGTQIRAHQELGWRYIEARLVNGTQFTDLPQAQFEEVCAELAAAGMQVSGFASAIANWSTKITDPFEQSIDTLSRAITRMNRLGAKFIRVMSYPNDGLPEEQWRDEAVRRLQVLGKMAEDGGIVLLVENCDGWASVSPQNYAEFFQMVNSPAVKAVYDTGNPASHGFTNTWEWYEAAKPHIAYVHIKAHTGPSGTHTWPDIGESKIRETIQDLLESGYNGFVSIEPHIQSVIHEKKGISNADAAYQSYMEYGQRLMQLVDRVKQARSGWQNEASRARFKSRV